MDYWLDAYNDDRIDTRTLEYAMKNEIIPDEHFDLTDPATAELLDATVIDLAEAWEEFRYYLEPTSLSLYRYQGLSGWICDDGDWHETETEEDTLQQANWQIDSTTALDVFRGMD